VRGPQYQPASRFSQEFFVRVSASQLAGDIRGIFGAIPTGQLAGGIHRAYLLGLTSQFAGSSPAGQFAGGFVHTVAVAPTSQFAGGSRFPTSQIAGGSRFPTSQIAGGTCGTYGVGSATAKGQQHQQA